MILLRIAIGWHFLYEGLEKIESTLKGSHPFTAEPYLRNATGPFAPYFRNLVPDADSRDMLDAARLKASWVADVDAIGAHYHFSEDQKHDALAELRLQSEFR